MKIEGMVIRDLEPGLWVEMRRRLRPPVVVEIQAIRYDIGISIRLPDGHTALLPWAGNSVTLCPIGWCGDPDFEPPHLSNRPRRERPRMDPELVPVVLGVAAIVFMLTACWVATKLGYR